MTRNVTTKELRSLIGQIQIDELKEQLVEYEKTVARGEKGIIAFLVKNYGLNPGSKRTEVPFTGEFS
ncbi:MAG: hypothetical protein QG650_24 [Patescibacteria group bacterium]|nr:hypothetical protein [Patescibacteria group bacterium]